MAESIQFDEGAAEEFAGRILEIINDGSLALMTSIGHRVGLFDALAKLPPATADAIAASAGLEPRYVQEWLGAMVAGRIIDYDPVRQTYNLPEYRAACLTRAAGPENLARTAQFIPLLGEVEARILDCFRKGGGVSYEAYPRFHSLMAEESAATHDAALVEAILPLVPGLPEMLESGIEVLDIGCGSGHAINIMAKAYPRSRFTGLDLSSEAIEAGQCEARQLGLDNVRFAVQDVADMNDSERYDLVTAFDAVHDQAKPDQVLRNVVAALRPGGSFLMADIAASSRLEDNLDHFIGPFLYTVSCLHCTAVSLGADGPGLGAMWGDTKACQMLSDAGFAAVKVERMEDDPLNFYYVATKPG